MRYLILSDIHSNLTALDAVIAATKGRWQEAVCLGDLVGYGPDPNGVIDRIRELGAVTIRGNHDKAIAGLMEGEEFNPIAQFAVQWSREQLRPENRKYLVELPKGPHSIEEFSIVHGAVHDEDEYVVSPALALDGLLSAPTALTFFGHTHIQGGFTFRDDAIGVLHMKPAAGNQFASLNLEQGSRYLLNPGSIGQPRDGDPRAAFAIFDAEKSLVEFWRVPYDIDAVQQQMTQKGLPEPLVLRLSFGR
jgi:predicted phosphodiesterase